MLPPRPSLRPSGAGLATAGVVGAVALAHAWFAVADGRVPRDLGLYYSHLPGATGAWQAGDLSTVVSLLTEPGGWYLAALGGWLAVVGPGAAAFRLVDAAWVVVVMLAGVGIARRLAGPVAGLAAACLLGAAQGVVVQGRLGWIHVPEAALVLGAAWAWLRDRRLDGAYSVAAVASLGGLALAIRPSALAWVGCLGLAMALSSAANRPAVRRIALVAGAWLVGVLPWLLRLDTYFGAKWGARGRYAQVLPGVTAQMVELTSLAGAVVCAVGLVLALLRARPHAPGRLLAAWAVLPIWLFAVFRAGLDNHTVGLVAWAILAATGWSVLPRLGSGVALLLFLPGWAAQWIDGSRVPPRLAGLLGLLGVSLEPGLLNARRVYEQWRADEVVALLDATCGGERCTVAVDQGLFQPYGEEPGRLGLFLVGRPEVELLDLRDLQDPAGAEAVSALIHYDCGELDQAWRVRFPDSMEALLGLVEAQELRPAWSRPIDPPCRPIWFAPGGVVRYPDRLPPGNDAPAAPGCEHRAAPSSPPSPERR